MVFEETLEIQKSMRREVCIQDYWVQLLVAVHMEIVLKGQSPKEMMVFVHKEDIAVRNEDLQMMEEVKKDLKSKSEGKRNTTVLASDCCYSSDLIVKKMEDRMKTEEQNTLNHFQEQIPEDLNNTLVWDAY